MTAFAAPTLGRVATFRFGPLANLVRRYDAWAQQRRAIRQVEVELSTMTPRELADLGLTQGDIPDVARGRFRR
jgi:uncharacterized protein YjiS (DUF1127 family)